MSTASQELIQSCRALMLESSAHFTRGQHDASAKGLQKILNMLAEHCSSEDEDATPLRAEALQLYGKIVTHTNLFHSDFSQAIASRPLQLTGRQPDLEGALVLCLEHPAISPTELAPLCLQLLTTRPFSFADPLLQALMKNDLIADAKIEKLLKAKRHELLAKFRDPHFLASNQQLIYAIACQCHLNEYVYAISEAEKVLIEQLSRDIEAMLPEMNAHTKLTIAILSAYGPLQKTPFAEFLLKCVPDADSDPLFARILKTQVINPAIEKELSATIEPLKAISDATSLLVRGQYEENPYPRWNRLGSQSQTASFQQILGAQYPQPLPAMRNILVAGCGTGQHALNYALNNPESQLLAIDLSLSSLSYAMRMAKEMDVANIRFLHGDLLEVGYLSKTFDLIECCGVLHHMQDPIAGWQSLVNQLADHGWMLIGLYSKLGRQKLKSAHQYIKSKGCKGTPEEIRNCRQEIFALPNTNPIKAVTYWHDFYSLSTCRDLLFHTHEVQFTIPQIVGMLDALNLQFRGFYLPGGIKAAFKKMFADKMGEMGVNGSGMLNLQNWNLFEQRYPDTFSTMYLFWVTKR
jgi:SAM-dependent methyltransferase